MPYTDFFATCQEFQDSTSIPGGWVTKFVRRCDKNWRVKLALFA
jgi:hypothetical protein